MIALKQLRATFQDRMEGLILLCMGSLMAGLALSRQYWNFLNPKFSPLTLTAGVCIGVCGLALLLKPEPGRGTTSRLLRQAALLVFLILAAGAWEQTARELPPEASFTGPRGLSATAGAQTGGQTGAEAEIPAEPQGPRVTRDGVEYVRLNLAELYIMLDKGRKDFPAHFALRAQLTRPAALGGRALLSRIAVVCCLADSLDLGFISEGQGLDAAADGKWVEVYGHLQPLDAAGKKAAKAGAGGHELSLRIINPAKRIVAEHVEIIHTPDPPFLFEFREKEPFAWE
jgi:hypothetical protein